MNMTMKDCGTQAVCSYNMTKVLQPPFLYARQTACTIYGNQTMAKRQIFTKKKYGSGIRYIIYWWIAPLGQHTKAT